MLGRILQCLLQYAVQTRGDAPREAVRNLVGGKVDLHTLVTRDLVAQGFRRGRNPQEFKPRTMQAMRQGLNVLRKIPDFFTNVDDLAPDVCRGWRDTHQRMKTDTQRREPLNDVVVQLSSNAGTLFFLRVEQPLLNGGQR